MQYFSDVIRMDWSESVVRINVAKLWKVCLLGLHLAVDV